MTRVVAALLMALTLGLGLAEAQTPTALQRVRRTGVLRIGIDATYPPFGMAEGGDFSGFDVDIARAVARELGVRAELINASFDGVFPALQNGSFDAVVSAVTITEERQKTLLFWILTSTPGRASRCGPTARSPAWTIWPGARWACRSTPPRSSRWKRGPG